MEAGNNSNKAKIEQRFTQNLRASGDEQIISILKNLEDKGDLFIIKPLLFELYSKKRGEKLKSAILEFVRDIHENKVVPIIVDFIKSHFNDETTISVISACWQSRLDFSDQIDVFIDVLIYGNYFAAVEAFSVIECTLDFLEIEEIDNLVSSIKNKTKSVSSEKIKLVEETLQMINEYKVARLPND